MVILFVSLYSNSSHSDRLFNIRVASTKNSHGGNPATEHLLRNPIGRIQSPQIHEDRNQRDHQAERHHLVTCYFWSCLQNSPSSLRPGCSGDSVPCSCVHLLHFESFRVYVHHERFEGQLCEVASV